MNKPLLFVLFILPGIASSQNTFMKIFGESGNDICHSVLQAPDSGYFLLGTTSDLMLIRTNSYGDTIWTKTYGTSDNDGGYAMVRTFDGGLLLVGEVGYHDVIFLLRIDSIGDTLWAKTFNWGFFTDYGLNACQTSDSGFIVAGTAFIAGENNMCLIKTNSMGDTLWTRLFRTDGHPWSCSVQQTYDGGYVITGTKSTSSIYYDALLIRLNSSGDTLWSKTYGGPSFDLGSFVQSTTDSGFVITGSTLDTSTNKYDILLIKTDNTGDTLWMRILSDTSTQTNCLSNVIIKTTDNAFVVGGSLNGDAFIFKMDMNGDTLWTRTYGGPLSESVWQISETMDGGYILAGIAWSFGNAGEMLLIKTDSSGVSGCYQVYPSIQIIQRNLDIRNPFIQILSNPCYVNQVPISNRSGYGITDLCLNTSLNIDSELGCTLFPNPASTFLMLSSPHARVTSISIFDIFGKKVFTTEIKYGSSEIHIDIRSMHSGIYFAKVKSEYGETTLKLIKH